MYLSAKGAQALSDSPRLRMLLAVQEECHVASIERWLRENNDNLTKASVLNFIHKETGIPISELLTEVPA